MNKHCRTPGKITVIGVIFTACWLLNKPLYIIYILVLLVFLLVYVDCKQKIACGS